MRQTFRGFYSDEDRINEVLKSDDTRIILDTNVLLNLYNYHDEIREQFFEILKKLEDKLWLPYHVVLEYQRHRVAVLRREKQKFHTLKGTADTCLKELGKVRDQALFKRIPEVKTITEEYREQLKPILEEYKEKIEELNKSQLAAPKNDPIRGVITELFEGRVGGAPQNEIDLKELVVEAEKRFEAKIPPGYRDEKKEDAEFHYGGLNYKNRHGDFIIWKQIVEMAKIAGDQVKSIVFVTDDGKEDWWHIDKTSKDKMGARAELRDEVYRDGGVEHFSMYDSARFLELASKSVDVEIDKASLDDVRSRVLQEGISRKRISQMVLNSMESERGRKLCTNKVLSQDLVDSSVEEGDELRAAVINKIAFSEAVDEYISLTIPEEHRDCCQDDLWDYLEEHIDNRTTLADAASIAMLFIANYMSSI